MKLSIVGTGYVGLVAGACFADSGHQVICVDCDEQKIRRLNEGEIPIYEPGLSEIVQRCKQAGRLEFTTDLESAVKESRAIFLAVGTPQADDGSADLSSIFQVATSIGQCMDGYRVIIMKSTVPIGTHEKVTQVLAAQTDHPFDYVSNPEFMKEGAAVEDFMKPDRVVIGATNHAVFEIMRELYAPFMRRDERILMMDPASAEMTKYAANAMLAARISFMNEIGGLCERFGADVENVRRGIGSDSRIGSGFLYAGVGYGGSCFPKDVAALVSIGRSKDYPMYITQAVDEVNLRQRKTFASKVIDHFGNQCKQTTLAVWGLAFKSRTDDIRESPAIAGIKMFLDQGMKIHAHDPEAMTNAREEFGDKVTMCDDGYAALEGADALVVFTDWPEFRNPDFDIVADSLKNKVIFDGRNLYNPQMLAKRGFTYVCIGRPVVKPA